MEILPQIQVFIQGWTAQGKAAIERLRSSTFYPKQVCEHGILRSPYLYWWLQLEEVNWRQNLTMAQSGRSKLKQPNALFEFVIKEGEVSEE